MSTTDGRQSVKRPSWNVVRRSLGFINVRLERAECRSVRAEGLCAGARFGLEVMCTRVGVQASLLTDAGDRSKSVDF